MDLKKIVLSAFITAIAAAIVAAFFEDIRALAIGAIVWFLGTSLPVPVWIITICAVLILILSVRIATSILAAATPREWESYIEDLFDGMRWRWDWKDARITSLRPYCPGDDTILVFSVNRYTEEVGLVCETCDRTFGPFRGDVDYTKSRIERQIDRKVRTGAYKSD